MTAELLWSLCVFVVLAIAFHECAHALMGRPLPPREPERASPGVDYRDVVLWSQLHAIPMPRPWPGIERRGRKPLTASSFETHRLTRR